MDDILINWGPISHALKVSEKTAMRYKQRGLIKVKYNKAGHPYITKQEADKFFNQK